MCIYIKVLCHFLFLSEKVDELSFKGLYCFLEWLSFLKPIICHILCGWDRISELGQSQENQYACWVTVQWSYIMGYWTYADSLRSILIAIEILWVVLIYWFTQWTEACLESSLRMRDTLCFWSLRPPIVKHLPEPKAFLVFKRGSWVQANFFCLV